MQQRWPRTAYNGPYQVQDVCERRRSIGVIFSPRRIQVLSTQGCYCPETCTGVDKKGCNNAVPDFNSEYCVKVNTGRGLDPEVKYLTAKVFLPAGALVTAMGGVTVQSQTQPRAFSSFTRLHKQQHEQGAQKFQYSVQVGSKGLKGSTAWLIPPNDFPLLHSLLGHKDKTLRALTADDRVAPGLGQYAQHTCCEKHVNAHLFPIFVLHESEEHEGNGSRKKKQSHDEWMELKTVAIRVDRDIKAGEEILIKYVGSGKSGDFRKVFDCSCCKCKGKCY